MHVHVSLVPRLISYEKEPAWVRGYVHVYTHAHAHLRVGLGSLQWAPETER